MRTVRFIKENDSILVVIQWPYSTVFLGYSFVSATIPRVVTFSSMMLHVLIAILGSPSFKVYFLFVGCVFVLLVYNLILIHPADLAYYQSLKPYPSNLVIFCTRKCLQHPWLLLLYLHSQ